MYAAIRVYRYRAEKREELDRRVQSEFVPLVSKLPGYVAYFGVDQGDGKWASISVFQSKEVAAASNRTAADWVQKRLQGMMESGPDITMGEVVASGTSKGAFDERGVAAH